LFVRGFKQKPHAAVRGIRAPIGGAAGGVIISGNARGVARGRRSTKGTKGGPRIVVVGGYPPGCIGLLMARAGGSFETLGVTGGMG